MYITWWRLTGVVQQAFYKKHGTKGLPEDAVSKSRKIIHYATKEMVQKIYRKGNTYD